MHLLHLDQPLLEINITPDRGYTLSYRGVAREYHHSTGAAYTDPAVALNEKAPEPADYQPGTPVDIDVEIDDNNPIHGVPGCDRYYARIVKDFNPNAHTPNWMRRRLIRAGMRSISLAVDVTNYVMLDLGQPMHAYDLDKLEGPIVVRRANEGEKLTTLDGKEHDLSVEDLLITDSPNGERGSRILGLAGVMGGLYGEVTADTKNILLEAAHFDQVTIARSARRHKIPSEASRRFERGVDTALACRHPDGRRTHGQVRQRRAQRTPERREQHAARQGHPLQGLRSGPRSRPRRGHQPHLRHPDRHWLHGGRWRQR